MTVNTEPESDEMDTSVDDPRFTVTEDGKLEENEDARADFEENLTFN